MVVLGLLEECIQFETPAVFRIALLMRSVHSPRGHLAAAMAAQSAVRLLSECLFAFSLLPLCVLDCIDAVLRVWFGVYLLVGLG